MGEDEALDAGEPVEDEGGAQVGFVDPDTRTENPAGRVGEIWVQVDNVAMGYWQNPQHTEKTFGAKLVSPSPGKAAGPWLRPGDLGVIFEERYLNHEFTRLNVQI